MADRPRARPPAACPAGDLLPSRIARSGLASTSVAMAWRNGANDNVDSPDPPRSTHCRGDGELPGRRPAHLRQQFDPNYEQECFVVKSTVRIRCRPFRPSAPDRITDELP